MRQPYFVDIVQNVFARFVVVLTVALQDFMTAWRIFERHERCIGLLLFADPIGSAFCLLCKEILRVRGVKLYKTPITPTPNHAEQSSHAFKIQLSDKNSPRPLLKIKPKTYLHHNIHSPTSPHANLLSLNRRLSFF